MPKVPPEKTFRQEIATIQRQCPTEYTPGTFALLDFRKMAEDKEKEKNPPPPKKYRRGGFTPGHTRALGKGNYRGRAQLAGGYVSKHKDLPDIRKEPGLHKLAHLPEGKSLYCYYCRWLNHQRPHKPRKTCFCCGHCKVPLCKEGCIRIFHQNHVDDHGREEPSICDTNTSNSNIREATSRNSEDRGV